MDKQRKTGRGESPPSSDSWDDVDEGFLLMNENTDTARWDGDQTKFVARSPKQMQSAVNATIKVAKGGYVMATKAASEASKIAQQTASIASDLFSATASFRSEVPENHGDLGVAKWLDDVVEAKDMESGRASGTYQHGSEESAPKFSKDGYQYDDLGVSSVWHRPHQDSQTLKGREIIREKWQSHGDRSALKGGLESTSTEESVRLSRNPVRASKRSIDNKL